MMVRFPVFAYGYKRLDLRRHLLSKVEFLPQSCAVREAHNPGLIRKYGNALTFFGVPSSAKSDRDEPPELPTRAHWISK